MSTDCDVCKPTPNPPHEGPGVPVPMLGTRHRPTCPLIPQLPDEAKQRLREKLAEVAAARRRAQASAHTYIIGGGS